MTDMSEYERYAMIAEDPELVAKQLTALKYARIQLNVAKAPLEDVFEMISNWCDPNNPETKAALLKIHEIDHMITSLSVFLLDRLDET